MSKFIGSIKEVLIETNDGNYSIGHTDNFLKVKVNKIIKSNTLVKVKITKLDNLVLEGVVYEEFK